MSFLSSNGLKSTNKTTRIVRPVDRKPEPTTAPVRPANRLSRPTDVLSEPARQARPSPKPTPQPAPSRAVKRKPAVPNRPQFESDSEGDSDDEALLQPAKKAKTTNEPDGGEVRKVRDTQNWSEEQGASFELVHGQDLTSGSHSAEFWPAFDDEPDSPFLISLQYPNATQPERFKLVLPKKSEDYNPHEDIVETTKRILTYYLPPSTHSQYLDDSSGIPFKLTRAFNRRKRIDYKAAIDEFNNIIATARTAHTIQHHLDSINTVPLPLVTRILDQITVRTVSPQSEILRAYQSFSSNTYGELLPPFNSQIFRDTNLRPSSVFLDLGSGVGNVVLQAALEIGSESHGIEMMPNPCKLARDQAQEFPARCRMWGLSTGSVNLLDGDFLDDTRLAPILQRADVVLVNNELFSPQLNEELRTRFLDLKEGARVVSLKSFVPPGWKLTERTSESICAMLEVERKEFWSGCVSWTNRGGDYFVATKDSSRIERILKKGRRPRA